MNKADTSTESKNSRAIIILAVLAIGAAVLSSLPIIQTKTRALFFSKENRLILAKVNAFYGTDQKEYLILKIKDTSGIQIEIFEVNSQPQGLPAQQNFKQRFELLQDSDAYITLDKNTTNLALSDVDKDGQLDILAPSVDRNGNLRLNTYRFNSELKSFEPIVEIK